MKITVNGQETEGKEVDFEIAREEWNAYKLLDGGTIRIKTVVSRIIQAFSEDGQPIRNRDGTLQYVIMSQNIIVAKM